jgi:hypothetical protein
VTVARVGISITKSVSFRGVQQEFSNVYYYDGGISTPSVVQADAMIDELVTIEKTFHSTLVNFMVGRLWSQGGSPSTNNMISQKTLSGTGARATFNNFDRERAFLFRLRAGVDSRGQPVYLRKWYHSCGLFTGSLSLLVGHLENTTSFTAGERDSLEAQMGSIGSLSSGGGGWVLCAKSGRLPTAGQTWEAHKFLEHHQLGDMWRAA